MNIERFKELWESEREIYKAWGDLVVDKIRSAIAEKGANVGIFFKVPPSFRLKETSSLVDKAFYRNKNYQDPYLEIEDKVGARFIVLLIDDLKLVCEVIRHIDLWTISESRNFIEEKEKNPLLFTYQSVHFILRPKAAITHSSKVIPQNITCEVQIRTLLQHAHSELTHDSVYKSNKTIKPVVHRTLAKSMALIETTDGFFQEVTNELNTGPLKEHRVLEILDSIYRIQIKLEPSIHKSALIIWDAFEDLITDTVVSEIQNFLNANNYIYDIVRNKYATSPLYQQSTIFFIYWMLKTKPNRLKKDWPLPSQAPLQDLASDIGISTGG